MLRKRIFLLCTRNGALEELRSLLPAMGNEYWDAANFEVWRPTIVKHLWLQSSLTSVEERRLHLIANCVIPAQAWRAVQLMAFREAFPTEEPAQRR